MRTVAIALLGLLAGFSATVTAAPSLEEIVQSVEQANNRIGVLETEGRTRSYEWDTDTMTWNATPQTTTFRCVIENKRGGRYVLHQDPVVMKWEHGLAPYLAEWTMDVRDAEGYVTHFTKSSQQHDGHQLINTPSVTDEVVRSRKGFWANGGTRAERIFSGLGFTSSRALRNMPIHLASKAKDFVVTDLPDGNVQVRFADATVCITWDSVLDPRKDFALVRYTYTQRGLLTTSGDELVMSDEVLEHKRLANGTWFPVRCVNTRRYSKEFAEEMNKRYPPTKNYKPERDPYAPQREELVLTKVDLLEGAEAEKQLSEKVPDQYEVKQEE